MPSRRYWRIIILVLIMLFPSGCRMRATADDLFVGTWSGHISGQGRDNMLAIMASGVWDSSFRMEISEITIGPRMELQDDITGRPIKGTATVNHHAVGSNFEGFNGGAAFLEPETTSAALTGYIETSVQSSTAGEEAWRMELDLSDFERGGTIELYGEEETYTLPIERSMIYMAMSSRDILGTNLSVEFSDDGNTMYLHERVGDSAGVTGYELTGELHRVTPQKKTFGKDIKSGEEITTDKNTRLDIDIPDLGEVVMSPGSKASITSSGSDDEIVLEMIRGQMLHRIKTAKDRGIDIYKVVNPQSIAGVRGTSFISSVYEGLETIIVLEGSVEVSDKNGTAPPVIVGKDQMLVIDEDGSTAGPVDLDPDYPRWWEEVEFVPADKRSTDSTMADEEAEEIEIDFSSLYNGDFRDGQYFKADWWQSVDGEESTGWIVIDVSEEDEYFEIEYEGELGEHKFSGSDEFLREDTTAKFIFYNKFTGAQSHILHDILRETIWNMLDENFSHLEYVGQRSSMFGYESEATGFDTYGGVDGLTFTLKAGTELTYELTVAPDFPVNLYVYNAVDEDGQYRAELVEYRE
jgi:hypothetical protein